MDVQQTTQNAPPLVTLNWSEGQLGATISGISHPIRRKILERLGKVDATVNELAKEFSVSPSLVARHAKILALIGLVERRRDAKGHEERGGPYRLRAKYLRQVAEWLTQFHRFWDRAAA